MRDRRRRLVAAGVALTCAVLWGCGEDNGTPPATATPTPTSSPTLTATFTPSGSPTPTPTFTPTATATPSRTPTATLTFTSTATATTTPTPTPSQTPTATTTPTVTSTPTLGPLGTRHFVLDSSSVFQVVLPNGLAVVSGQIEGQTNGQMAPAFLDLQAGKPGASGLALLNITNASDYFFVDQRPLLFLCLKPQVPVMAAGAVGCQGGPDFSIVLTQNHKLGQVGQNGFTVQACTMLNGSLEGPHEICAGGPLLGATCRTNADCDSSPGAGDGVCGLGMATCTAGQTGAPCQADADCDSSPGALDGTCGQPGVHPGVCNGQFMPSQAGGDTGPGEVIIAPFTQLGLNGLPVRITMQQGPPCGAEPHAPTFPVSAFALTSGLSRTVIDNVNAVDGQSFTYNLQGQNFSCADWQDPNGPGRLVLSAPLLDVPLVGDVVTSFTFDGTAPNPTPTPSP